ncbi:MAG: hypothetical protein AB7V46_06905 [Thermomicrobiales bacterium]
MKDRAYARGRSTIWSNFSRLSLAVLDDVYAPPAQPFRAGGIMAAPGLAGLRMMTDGTGILQHAIGTIPDRRHGYCLDDNARALILMNQAEDMDPAERLSLSVTFASFVQHCWNPDTGRFRNFMRFDRQWAEDQGSDDSNGRALWSLGHSVAKACSTDIELWALEWFDRTGHIALELSSPRAIAFAMLGAYHVLTVNEGHSLARDILECGGGILDQLLSRSRRPDWTWFEAVLGYDNPRLSEALLCAGITLNRKDWCAEGEDSLRFICERQIGVNGHFRPIGSDGFGLAGETLPFDQQPLEAWAAIDACRIACIAGFDDQWRAHAEAAYGWFHGANDRGESLVDIKQGICRDGLTPRGVNRNSGAESLLAYQLSYYAMAELIQICAREGESLAQTGSGAVPRPVAAA